MVFGSLSELVAPDHHTTFPRRSLLLLLVVVCTAVALLAGTAPQIAAAEYRQVTECFSQPDVCVQIIPRMELLAGVLSQTSWMDDWGPSDTGNAYFQNLQEHFAPFADHRAVSLTEELLQRGMIHDALPHLVFRLSPLPQLQPHWGYGDMMVRRAGGTRILEQLRDELIDLAEKSEFSSFFADNEEMYRGLVTQTAEQLHQEKVIGWLEGFFGWSADEYHLIIAPGMFPAGGYGGTIHTPDERMLAIQVIRADDSGGATPDIPTGRNLQSLSLHEWGHSFVDPTLAEHPHLVRQLDFLYEPVRQRMKRQAYTNTPTFINEQVLRAVEVMAHRDLYGTQAYLAHKFRTEVRGFYLTSEVLQQLEIYRENREEYPTFEDFAPKLLRELAEAEPQPPLWFAVPWIQLPRLLLSLAVLTAVMWWIIWGWRRRQRRLQEMDDGEFPPEWTSGESGGAPDEQLDDSVR